MANYDHYDAPYDRGSRYDDRPRYDTYTREREAQHLKPYPPASRALVRQRDSDLSVEEVTRDFPPPGYRDTRRSRSAEPGYDYDPRYDYRNRRSRGPGSIYYQEEQEKVRKRVISKQEKILAAVAGAAIGLVGKEAYDRYDAKKEGHEHEVERNYLQSAALGAAGAFAGYQGAEMYSKHNTKEGKRTQAVHIGRDGRYEYYSDDDGDGPAKKGQKKFLESVLGVTSLGAAIKMFTGGDEKSSRRSRSRSSSRDSRRSRGSRGSRGDSRSKIQKAAMASLIAGATEAFRVSKEPGGWKGEKAKRVVTAALGAGALGGAHSEGHSKKDIFESVVGGLMGNRMLHGSKSNIEADERDPGRSRSRSRARARSSSRGGGSGGGGAGLAALAAGLAGLGAKKAMDNRSRSGSRRRGSDSDQSRSPSRRRRSRSRSVVDKARNSLARLGIGGGGADRDGSDREEPRRGSSRRRRYSDDYDVRDRDHDRDHDGDYRGSSRREKSRDRDSSHYDDDRSYQSRRKGARSDAGSETDLGDSDQDRKAAKKMKAPRR